MENFLQKRVEERRAAADALGKAATAMHDHLKRVRGQISSFYAGHASNVTVMPDDLKTLTIEVNQSAAIEIKIKDGGADYTYDVNVTGKGVQNDLDEGALADIILDTIK